MLNRNALVAIFTLVLLMALPSCAYGSAIFTIGSSVYSMDGRDQSMDVAPYVNSGRTYLPVRYAALAVGAVPGDISWDPDNRQVTIIDGGRTIELTVGSTLLTLNGTATSMGVAPVIAGARVMLPVRFLAQALGIDVIWNPATRTVVIDELVVPVSTQSVSLSASTVPALRYDPSIQTTDRDFAWKYQGNTFTWHVETPQPLLDWDRQVNQLAAEYYGGQCSQEQLLQTMPEGVKELVLSDAEQEDGDLASWVNDGDNGQWAGYLADRLAICANNVGLDYFHTAEFIQSFVDAIPYQLTDLPELPAQTIIDNGDCKDKSVLLAAILKGLSYKVALLEFPPGPGETAGHMAVGVAIKDSQIPHGGSLSYYLYNGYKYYFAETTSPNWTLGAASVTEPAQIYAVN